MKKSLLFIAVLALGSFNLMAQCTPGANFADSTFGAWPDTIQNFPHATVNVAYSTDLNFKVPSDAGDVDPAYAGYSIQNFSVDAVTGLPTGMSYSCNISNCTYNGGQNGCAQISGTSATAGTYDITISITANVDPGIGFTVPVPYEFTGYKVIVDPVAGISVLSVDGVTIFPNPANDVLYMHGLTGVSTVAVVSLNGQVVKTMDVTGAQGEINISDLTSGVYMVHFSSAEGTSIQKFVKK